MSIFKTLLIHRIAEYGQHKIHSHNALVVLHSVEVIVWYEVAASLIVEKLFFEMWIMWVYIINVNIVSAIRYICETRPFQHSNSDHAQIESFSCKRALLYTYTLQSQRCNCSRDISKTMKLSVVFFQQPGLQDHQILILVTSVCGAIFKMQYSVARLQIQLN